MRKTHKTQPPLARGRAPRMPAVAAGLLLVTPIAVGLPASLLLWPLRAEAVGEQNANLRGNVIEAGTGIAVPGAKVQIESPNMIGGARSQLTDDNGRFEFLQIPPGRYLITILFEGIRPVRERVKLDLGETQDLTIPFSAELAQEETTTIVEERQRFNADKVATGRVLSADEESKLPTGRRYQLIVQQAPGVTGGSNPVMAGGTSQHNRYLVDGMDTTDPVTNTFASNYNFDTISQVDTLVTPLDAEYNSLGGVINLVTKTGSDQFQIDSSVYINSQALSSGTVQGTQLYEGKLLQQNQPPPPQAQYQFNLNLAGPIIKQKLWYYISFEYKYQLSSVTPGPPLNTQHPALVRNDFYPHIKLTWAPAARHRVSLSLSGDPAFLNNLRQSNNYAPEAEYHQNQGGFNGSLIWDWNITDHAILSVTGGYIFERLYVQPQNGDLTNPAHYDAASNIVYNASDISPTDDQRHRFQLDPKITWFKSGWTGSHTIKFGATFSYLRNYVLSNPDTGNYEYIDYDTPGAPIARNPNGTALPTPCNPVNPYPMGMAGGTPCFQVQYTEPPLAQVRQSYSAGTYLQDIWKPTKWLTIIPGLRLDWGVARNSLDQVVQNLIGLGPRIQTTLDLTRDGKTLLKVGYGRANEVSTLNVAASADTGGTFNQFQYNAATGRFDQYVTSGGGATGYNLTGICTSGPDKGKATLSCGNEALNFDPPHADTVVASIEREVYANIRGSIAYTYRKLDSLWNQIQLNDLYTLDNTNHNYINPNAGAVYAYRPTPGAFRTYDGVDFVLEGTPNSNWNFFASYTLSYLYGNTDGTISGIGTVPRLGFQQTGFLPDDHRHQIKGQVSYSIHGLTIGSNFAFVTGGPATRAYYQSALGAYGAQFAWRGVDPGSDPNNIRGWAELRSPDVMLIDLRAQYDLYELTRQHISLIADFFNALDLGTPTTNSNLVPTYQAGFNTVNIPGLYGTVSSRQPGFRVQFALRYQWGQGARPAPPPPTASADDGSARRQRTVLGDIQQPVSLPLGAARAGQPPAPAAPPASAPLASAQGDSAR